MTIARTVTVANHVEEVMTVIEVNPTIAVDPLDDPNLTIARSAAVNHFDEDLMGENEEEGTNLTIIRTATVANHVGEVTTVIERNSTIAVDPTDDPNLTIGRNAAVNQVEVVTMMDRNPAIALNPTIGKNPLGNQRTTAIPDARRIATTQVSAYLQSVDVDPADQDRVVVEAGNLAIDHLGIGKDLAVEHWHGQSRNPLGKMRNLGRKKIAKRIIEAMPIAKDHLGTSNHLNSNRHCPTEGHFRRMHRAWTWMTSATSTVNLVLQNHLATSKLNQGRPDYSLKFEKGIAFDFGEANHWILTSTKNLVESNFEEMNSRGMAPSNPIDRTTKAIESMVGLVVANYYLTNARKLLHEQILFCQEYEEREWWPKFLVEEQVKKLRVMDHLIVEAMHEVEAARSRIVEAAAMVADPNSPSDSDA